MQQTAGLTIYHCILLDICISDFTVIICQCGYGYCQWPKTPRRWRIGLDRNCLSWNGSQWALRSSSPSSRRQMQLSIQLLIAALLLLWPHLLLKHESKAIRLFNQFCSILFWQSPTNPTLDCLLNLKCLRFLYQRTSLCFSISKDVSRF